jgi:hypothetical protein
MQDYRIFELNQDGNVAGLARRITAANDQEAILEAEAMIGGLDLEVWQASRLVARLARPGCAQIRFRVSASPFPVTFSWMSPCERIA